MPIITLTTDLGLRDHYVAAVKGAILHEIPTATIVDVTHLIDSYDIAQAAFVARNAYQQFPTGTIHMVSVKPLDEAQPDFSAIYSNGHYFIGTDNGLFSLLFDEPPEKAVSIQLSAPLTLFPTRDVFAKAACHLARGGTLEVLGPRKTELRAAMRFEPLVDDHWIRGSVQYIDTYGNLITNIRKASFLSVQRGRSFSISFRSPTFSIQSISTQYTDVLEGDLMALFGESGFLEIAIHAGPAHSLLGMKVRDTVTVEFHDH